MAADIRGIIAPYRICFFYYFFILLLWHNSAISYFVLIIIIILYSWHNSAISLPQRHKFVVLSVTMASQVRGITQVRG